MRRTILTQNVSIMTRNKILVVTIMAILATLCAGATAPPAWIELPILMHKSLAFVTAAYTVYGRVTVGETQPLEGAEIHVNRIVDGEHAGAGMAVSNEQGEWHIEVIGQADALRIWIIYPAQYKPWGVQAPVISWGLTSINWTNPPASCGPIHWMATWGATPTPSQTPTLTPTPTITATPTRTLTPSITPTATETPIHTPTVTETAIVIPSPPPNPPMPDTMLGVAQESLRSQWRLERVIYLLAVAALGLIAKIAKMGNDQSKGG